MALVTVSLSLAEIGLEVRPGVEFMIRFRARQGAIATADYVLDPTVGRSASTDVAGLASVTVLESDDIILGDPAYLVIVGSFLSEARLIVGDSTVRQLLAQPEAQPHSA